MEPNERLSMLIDDAASATELDELHHIGRDPERQQAWARYHLIGDSLRDSLPPRIDPQFASKVALAIAAESITHTNLTPLTRAVRPGRARWRRPLALATAATLATVAILGGYRERNTNGNSAAVAERIQPMVTQLTIALPGRTNTMGHGGTVMPDGEYQRRLNSYLVNFNEQRSHVGMPSVTPYARVVGFESGTER